MNKTGTKAFYFLASFLGLLWNTENALTTVAVLLLLFALWELVDIRFAVEDMKLNEIQVTLKKDDEYGG